MNPIRDCILEVDDDANDIFFLRHAFKHAGIANPVRVVGDGEQAIAYLSGTGPYADRAAYPLPGLVLLDLKLPRKSGLEVLQWLQDQPVFQNLVVVVFSASSDPTDIQRSYTLGAKAFVIKPIELHQCVEFAKSLKACWLEGQQCTPGTEPKALAAAHVPAGSPDPSNHSPPSRLPDACRPRQGQQPLGGKPFPQAPPMKSAPARLPFICPECGAEESATTTRSQLLASGSGGRRSYQCKRCGWAIPAHLAECWGITPEEARKEWREVYRGLELLSARG